MDFLKIDRFEAGRSLYQRLENLAEPVVELKAIKQGDDTHAGLIGRDRAARAVAENYSEQLGTDIAEFQDKVLDLHIDLQLEIKSNATRTQEERTL